MPPEDLLAIFERDRAALCVMPACHQTAADRRTLLAEMSALTTAKIRLATLAEAEYLAIPGASRTAKVSHKAAAEAYETALKLLTDGTDET